MRFRFVPLSAALLLVPGLARGWARSGLAAIRTGRSGFARRTVAPVAPPPPAAEAPAAPAALHLVAKEADRRAHARLPLDRGALLELDGRRTVAVNLLDISAGGAGVELRGTPPAPGASGRLVIDTAVLPVRVARAGDGRLGLAFLAQGPETAAAVRRIVAETAFVRAA